MDEVWLIDEGMRTEAFAEMNPSGLTPIEYNVIIDQNPTAEKIGSIYISNETQEKRMHLETRGVIVAVSPMAFAFADWPEDVAKPVPGDKVAFAQHAGAFIDGTDGKKYRIVKDKDILAVIV